MKLPHTLLTALTLIVVTTATMSAQEAADTVPEPLRPVASWTMIDVGHEQLLDSYLSPVTYSGTSVAVTYERMQAMRHNPERWTSALEATVDYANTANPVGNHTTHAVMAGVNWAMLRRMNNLLTPRLNVLAGGMADLRGGAIYNEIGSNNVVSAKVRVSLGIKAQASYPIRVKSLPVTLRYQVALPVVGTFFAPDYDEAYYEIYLGNTKNLAHVGWWGNRFDMTNLLTADLHLGGTDLRIGYRNRIERSWIRNVNTRIVTHNFVIGIGGEWLTLNKRKPQAKNVISAY